MRFSKFQIRWREPMGRPECPYMHRSVITVFGYSLRLHQWHRSDDKRSYHDHAWWFWTIVLWGRYDDHGPNGVDRLRMGSLRFRPSTHRHFVDVPKGGAVTLLLTGPNVRQWGFWVDGVLIRKRQAYFKKYGHPPCDEQ